MKTSLPFVVRLVVRTATRDLEYEEIEIAVGTDTDALALEARVREAIESAEMVCGTFSSDRHP